MSDVTLEFGILLENGNFPKSFLKITKNEAKFP